MGRLEALEHLGELVAAVALEALPGAVDQQIEVLRGCRRRARTRISSRLMSGLVFETGIV